MVTREELRQDSRARGVEKKKLGDERNEKRPLGPQLACLHGKKLNLIKLIDNIYIEWHCLR